MTLNIKDVSGAVINNNRENAVIIESSDGSSSSSSASVSSSSTPSSTTSSTNDVNNLNDSNETNTDLLNSYNNKMKNISEYSFPRRIPIDIEFQDIKYTIKELNFRKRKFERKEILHSVSGAFRSGQLTAIMGPSGAGKSTLLNILAGYVETGVTGSILVNGKNRSSNSQSFRDMSAYIHQDDAMRKYLTVEESMTVAAHLKLGFNVTKEYKNSVINKVLVSLGLDKHYKTYSCNLSGGQKKRLAIALEMINNPPVIFLDEPTTGLDSSSCTSCISLLKRLAQEGRTIICTIHQPSALLFEMFDKLHAVANGNCIYQGPTKQLVPFMADLGLQCPSYHNPADFLMEVAVGEYEIDLMRMVNAASKRYNEERDYYNLMIEQQVEKLSGMDLPPQISKLMKNEKLFKYATTAPLVPDFTTNIQTNNSKIQPASLIMQFWLLFMRNYTSSVRNTFLIVARIFVHIFISSLFGYLYSNVGKTATTVLANYVYLYGTILLVVYTGKMAVVLSFPLEMEMLTREHFNRWYKLGPYYLSIITFEIPFQMFCAMLYVIISYYLTGNYYEPFRFYYFSLMCIMATVCAQSWGYFIGATIPIKLAVFIGPILAVLFSVFGFCTRYIDITPMLSWMWHISYFRAAFHGAINTVYGMNRPYLFCPDNAVLKYCHFKNPKIFLTDMLIPDQPNLSENIVLMCGVIFTLHILTIFVLWLRLNKR